MLCVQCKTELPEGSQFCPKCGHTHKISTPKSSSPLKVLGWMGLGVAIATIGFFAWQTTTKHSSIQMSRADTAHQSLPAKAKASTVPRILSAQEIFQAANSSMALIETFDDEGHGLEQGSGFVVSGDGTVLTNYHVIRGASRATAKFGDGTESEFGGVVAFDKNRDVAVLKLAGLPKAFLHVGDSDDIEVGQKVIAIGSPLGLQNTVSEGIVSGLRNGIIQMSNPISPGSSGGAVLDRYGNVIGISVATVTSGQNLNFAVPINWAKPYLNNGTSQTFTDVVAENTVTNDLLDGSVVVPAQRFQSWSVAVNPNTMNNVEIEGQVTSSGGADGVITLALYAQGQSQPIYVCRSTNCTIEKKIRSVGVYVLTLDNRASPLFARTVTGKLSEKYVN